MDSSTFHDVHRQGHVTQWARPDSDWELMGEDYFDQWADGEACIPTAMPSLSIQACHWESLSFSL